MLFSGINLDGAVAPLSQNLSNLITMQKASAENIANVNTPGYKPKHYKFETFLGAEHSVMDTSLSSRMGASQLPEMLSTEGDGTVNLQNELMDMQKNLMYFNMVSKRLSTVINNIKTASNVGR
jgi:flagellar basal-body rod protein FlgB